MKSDRVEKRARRFPFEIPRSPVSYWFLLFLVLTWSRPSDGFAFAGKYSNREIGLVGKPLHPYRELLIPPPPSQLFVVPAAISEEESVLVDDFEEFRDQERINNSLRMTEENAITENEGGDCENEETDRHDGEGNSNDTRDENQQNAGVESTTQEDRRTFDREAIRRAALFSKGNRRKSSTSPSRSTSVGSRRIGSATKARTGARATDKLLDTVRKTARGKTAENDENKDPNSSASVFVTTSVVQQAIDDLLQQRRTASAAMEQFQPKQQETASFGLFGEPETQQHRNEEPLYLGCNMRFANVLDHVDVAHLRLSVFNEFPPEMHAEFCTRSCDVIARRAEHGATCIVSTASGSGIIIGSIECSSHEFQGTRLGLQRPEGSVLYITEVAVHPSTRRQGIGSDLLRAVDILADSRNVESLYLFVDTENEAAIELYRKAGYEQVVAENPIYLEFATSLNLQPGATRGRNHFLFCKHLRTPTWLRPEEVTRRQYDEVLLRQKGLPIVGSFGFEIPV